MPIFTLVDLTTARKIELMEVVVNMVVKEVILMIIMEARVNTKNNDFELKVNILYFNGNLGVEEFID